MSKKSLREVIKLAMTKKPKKVKQTVTGSFLAELEAVQKLFEASGVQGIELVKRYQDRTLSEPVQLNYLAMLPANTRIILLDREICLLNPRIFKVFLVESKYQNRYSQSPSFMYGVLDAKVPDNRRSEISRISFLPTLIRGLELYEVPPKGKEALEQICEILESLDGEFIEDVPANENENEKGEQKE